MSELDRWGDSAAVALLDEVTGAETEEALSMVRNGGSGEPAERPRYALLALAAAAMIVLVAGVALIKSRDTEEVEPPLATPPSSAPITTPVESTVPATAPATSAPATAPPSTAPVTEPPVTAPATEPPATTDAPIVGPAPTPVTALAAEPGFAGAAKVAYAGQPDILITGTLADGTPVLWHWNDGWSNTQLPGDNAFVPIAFVDSKVGYAVLDGQVQETRTSGLSWTPIDLASPSGTGVDVIGLAVGAGYVHVLGVDTGDTMTFRIYTMPLDGDAFTASDVTFPPPAGGEPVASFAFDGDSGWMAVTSRALMGVAEFVGGQWTPADVTCVNGGVTFASSGVEGDLVRSCDSGFMGSDGNIPEETQLMLSTDGGDTFSPVVLPSAASPFYTLLGRPDPTTIVVAGQGDGGVLVTHDNGNNGQGWQPLGLPEGSFVADFAADGAGLWVAAGTTSNGDQKVWVSTDAGTTWTG